LKPVLTMQPAVSTWAGEESKNAMYFIYFPSAAYLFAPLAYLPFSAARRLWMVARLVMEIAAVLLLARRLWGHDRFSWFAVSLVLLSRVSFDDHYFAQTNALVLLLITVTAILAESRPWIAGLAWVVSLSIKPFAVLMVAPLLRRRATLNWCVAWTALSVVLVAPRLPAYLVTLGDAVQFNLRRYPDNSSVFALLQGYFGLPATPLYWCIASVAATVGILASVRASDWLLSTALAVSTAFVVFPVVECHHLLVLAYCALVAAREMLAKECTWWVRGLVLLSLALLISVRWTAQLRYWAAPSQVLLWLTLIILVHQRNRLAKESVFESGC
jgi:hypothetical protein